MAKERSPLGLPSKFRSEKNPRNKLGMVFVIPRKKVLLSRISVSLGMAHSEVRNGMEWMEFREKMRFGGTKIP